MDEMEKYREGIERRYRDRRSNRRGGRRKRDYKSPPMFYWSDLWLLLPLVLSGLCMLFLSGCTAVKRLLRGE